MPIARVHAQVASQQAQAIAEVHIAAIAAYISVDGVEAMAFLRAQGKYSHAARPDIILLDLNLPYWSGFEVLEWIRQQPQLHRLPVIVFTSSSRPDDLARAYDAGANGYLVKPNSLADLTTQIMALRDFWLLHNRLPDTLGADPVLPSSANKAG